MYILECELDARDADAILEGYLEHGALSVAVLGASETGFNQRVQVMAQTRSWFRAQGFSGSPRRLLKSEWQAGLSGREESQELVPGVRVSVDSYGAFGDGAHPTTRVCAQFFVEYVRERIPNSVLDVGTGTGILGILAATLGAQDVTAFDFDPDAVKRARKNVRKNRVRVQVAQADVMTFLGGPYEVVFANLHTDLIQQCMPQLIRYVAPGGVLFLSGIAEKWGVEMTAFLSTFESICVVEKRLVEGWWGFWVKRLG
jgi:ribosomal protein L11 methyltransferase